MVVEILRALRMPASAALVLGGYAGWIGAINVSATAVAGDVIAHGVRIEKLAELDAMDDELRSLQEKVAAMRAQLDTWIIFVDRLTP